MFRFSLQLLSETFLILRIIHRDIVINVRRRLCELPVILVKKYSNVKFLVSSFGAELLLHADGQT